jgi:hypothetical protein
VTAFSYFKGEVSLWDSLKDKAKYKVQAEDILNEFISLRNRGVKSRGRSQ